MEIFRSKPTVSRSAALLLVVLVGLVLSPAAFADRLVLRNLEIISDRRIASFDEDGVKLDDNRVIGWDEIERGTTSADKQAGFNAMLGELGEHLYRIRQRLKVEDYEDLAQHAEAVYPRYISRRSETAYMVVAAVIWSRLAKGQREMALEPYLRALDYLRQRGAKPDLPGPRRLQCDTATGYSTELPPIWFDRAAAEKALPEVHRTLGQMRTPPPATRIYYATLAIAAGKGEAASRVLEGLEQNVALLGELRETTLAQSDLAKNNPAAALERLHGRVDRFSTVSRPVGLYWLAKAQTASQDPTSRKEGALNLLRLPALFGAQQPELAAAGLFEAMELLRESGDKQGAVALRKELLTNYGQTYHAGRVRAGLTQGKDS